MRSPHVERFGEICRDVDARVRAGTLSREYYVKRGFEAVQACEPGTDDMGAYLDLAPNADWTADFGFPWDMPASLEEDKKRFHELACEAGRLDLEKRLTREEWVRITREALALNRKHPGHMGEFDMESLMALVAEQPGWLAEFGW